MIFVLAMLRNPEAQRRGQEELDAIVGHGRLPTISDRVDLPYVRAICSEVLRFVDRFVRSLSNRHSFFFLKMGADPASG